MILWLQCANYCQLCTNVPVNLPLDVTLIRKQEPEINPTLSRRVTWRQTWRCWVSSWLLKTQVQTILVCGFGHGLRKLWRSRTISSEKNSEAIQRSSSISPSMSAVHLVKTVWACPSESFDSCPGTSWGKLKGLLFGLSQNYSYIRGFASESAEAAVLRAFGRLPVSSNSWLQVLFL